MSSDDVIELGSSDEETEPAPKKIKPMPNAMVCIPRTIHDVTIKPAKPSPASLPKGLLGKGITVKKITCMKPQTVNKNKPNGKPVHPSQPKIAYNPFSDHVKPVLILNKPANSNLTLVKPDYAKSNPKRPQFPFLKPPIKIQNPKSLHLPPSITVKKTVTNRPIVMLNYKGKQRLQQKKVANQAANDVMTVELDDDEAPAQNSSPQWYLRPEEQTESAGLEDENNKEPETDKMIEITIDDSPVKPVHNKRTHEVGAELAITIDDSPVKVLTDKNKNVESASDNEDDVSSSKVPQSKKKLEYPKDTEDNKTVEIEIEPIVLSRSGFIQENEDLLVPQGENKQDSDDLKKNNITLLLEDKIEIEVCKPSEFHPVYQAFIDLCFQLENSDDMKKIVEKKIKGYYRQVPKEYTESEEFTDMVSSKILSMKAGPEKMYLYIKDIVDELNLQRKLAKSQPQVQESKVEELVQVYSEENEYDSKRQRQIRKLEKTIKKLHRAIQKLEEQEVDFDDEDDSVYLLTERYKERMVRVYAKFCQLSNTKMPSEPRIQIDVRPGQPTGPAKRLEKWINKKVPIGTPLPFPDFHDVLRCVRQANEEDNLNFNEVDIMEQARDLFTRCGKKLQRRRQENEWRLAASRIAHDIDPADKNDELKQRLNENKKIAAVKETEIFNKFADRQNQLKLEAEEIGDKEAEESPVESEEEEAQEETSALENTEKRKERLKRLLHERSKKSTEEKENQPSNDGSKNEDKSTVSEAPVKTEEGDKEVETQDNQPETKDEDRTKENTETPKNDDPPEIVTETYTLSDDSNALESDIDELHLLQKLHSPNAEHSSSADSSDSDCRIAISDSMESDREDKNDLSDADDDVISIENSSYSEDEGDKHDSTQESNADSVQFINEDSMPSQDAEINADPAEVHAMEADDCREMIAAAPLHTNIDEYSEAAENILLASSEDDNSQTSQNVTEDRCVNLRDDLISIDETDIGSINNESVIQIQSESSPMRDEINSESALVHNELTAKNDNEVNKSKSRNSNEAKEAVPSNDEKSSESVEKMDVDEDHCIEADNTTTNEDVTTTLIAEKS